MIPWTPVGLAWLRLELGPGGPQKGELPLWGLSHCLSKKLSLQSQRTAQEAAPRGPEEREGASPGPPLGEAATFSTEWVGLPCAKTGMPTGDCCRRL